MVRFPLHKLAPAAFLLFLVASPPWAYAQNAKDLLGAWTLISSDTVSAGGERKPTLGANPTGSLVFLESGRFILILINPALPKFASNNRATGTAEENAAVMRGLVANYGTYSVSGKDLILKIEQSSFPNWSGTEQKRTILTLTSDDFKWSNPAGSTGGVAELVFKRTK